jgi:hypothetical protein
MISDVDTSNDPTQFQMLILAGLQHKPVFMGLLDHQWAAVDKRRAANRRARKQRRINRLRGA